MRIHLLLPLAAAAACTGAPTVQLQPLQQLLTPAGVTVSYTKSGSGPPLVLVHGAFSDHDTNWTYVRERLAREFTVYAVARRNRGETARTADHRLADEGADVAALIAAIDRPVFLVGHSYGAHVSLLAAAAAPQRVAKLVLYEPARPDLFDQRMHEALAERARAGDWDGYATKFFGEGLHVPAADLAAVRASADWAPILADAPASAIDIRALAAHPFVPEHFRDLRVPVLLQIGEHSPRDLYVTDALAGVLPNARIETLAGQAHEGMTTAPDLWAASVERFLAR